MAMAEATLDETYFTGLPYPVQRATGRTLGPVARALGYEPVEERYLDESFWEARADDAADPSAGIEIPVATDESRPAAGESRPSTEH
jgi:hypothetical protein